ncbi:putative glutamine amidotransferase-like class 1 domain-containing protein 3B, mitochondrial [Sarcophilus harrisii]
MNQLKGERFWPQVGYALVTHSPEGRVGAEVKVTWCSSPQHLLEPPSPLPTYWSSVFPATADAAMFAVRSAAASGPVFAGCRPWLRSGGQQLLSLAAFHGSAQRAKAKVAVILSGSGVYDGTEIHEASAILVHLSREGAEVKMYAPDISQMHVIDHTKGQPTENEKRNVLVESARIARGKVTDLSKLNSKDYDAVIFPGGFGVAKNLSTFAVDGKDCKVNKDVERILSQFHKEGKPIGLCCISPILAAKVIQGTEVTVGHEQEEEGKWPYCGTAEAIKALGAKHCVKEVTISF